MRQDILWPVSSLRGEPGFIQQTGEPSECRGHQILHLVVTWSTSKRGAGRQEARQQTPGPRPS